MPIYKFSFGPDKENNPASLRSAEERLGGKTPIQPIKISRQPDPIIKEENLEEDINRDAEVVTRYLAKGFHTHDRGIKEYFSNILIPDRDTGFHKMDVKIAGGDKTIMAWQQDRENARVKLPVMSINRENAEFDSTKFSPTHLPMARRFVDSDRSKIEFIYRPTPWLIVYSLTVWAERKTDAEYVLSQILTRFNPMAQWYVEDEKLKGVVDAWLNTYTDSSDIDVSPEEHPLVRYDYSIRASCWIPLPTKIVPSILGKVDSTEIVSAETLAELNEE